MLGAYIGLSVLDRGPRPSAAALLAAGLAVGAARRPGRTFHPAPAGRQCAGAGAGHARHRLHHRRRLPVVVGRRPACRCRRRVSCAAACAVAGLTFPAYRLAVVAFASCWRACAVAADGKTRLGAMIRAGVDDMQMARAVGIPVSRLFTLVFCLGAALAGAGGVIGGADPLGLSGPGRRHAAAGADRGDPRRRGQPGGRLRRQLPHRLRLHASARRCCPTSPTSSCSCR